MPDVTNTPRADTDDSVDTPRHMRRRTFLKLGVGMAAYAAFHHALRLDAHAHDQALRYGLQFFNTVEAETCEAICDRIWPADADDPGAREAGAVYYIDRALAGPYAEHQRTYLVGLEEVDRLAVARFDQPFRQLSTGDQDELLRAIDTYSPPDDGVDAMEPGAEVDRADAALARLDAASFFNLVRTHTMQGVFADPIYGGNRDFAGWRAVGYPGAYYLYTADEQRSFEPLDKPFQSVADL